MRMTRIEMSKQNDGGPAFPALVINEKAGRSRQMPESE